MAGVTSVGVTRNHIKLVQTAAHSVAEGNTDTLLTYNATPVIHVGSGLTYSSQHTVTVQKAGTYAIYGRCSLEAGTADGYLRLVVLYINGTAVTFNTDASYINGGTGKIWRGQVYWEGTLAVNDTLQLKARYEDNPTGGSVNTNTSFEGVSFNVREIQ